MDMKVSLSHESMRPLLLLLLLLMCLLAVNGLPVEEVILQNIDHLSPSWTHPSSRRRFPQKLIIDTESWGGCGDPVFFVPGPEAPLTNPFFPGSLPFDFAVPFKAMLLTLEHRFYGESLPFGPNMDNYTQEEWQFLSSRQYLEDIALLHQTITTRFGCSPDPRSPKYSHWITFGGSYPGLISAWSRLHYPHLFLGAVVSGSPIQISKALGSPLWMNELAQIMGPSCTRKVAHMSKVMDESILTEAGRSRLKDLFSYLPTAKQLDERSTSWFDFLTEVQGILTYAVSYNPNTTYSMYPWPLAGDLMCQKLTEAEEYQVEEVYAQLGREICIFQQQIGLPCGIPFGRSWLWQRCTELALPFFPYDPASGLWSVHLTWENLNASCIELNGRGIGASPETYLGQERWSGNPSTDNSFGAYTQVGNFFFAVGTYDPSLKFLPITGITETVTARLIPNTGHGVLLTNFFWPNNPGIAAATEELRAQIVLWLSSGRLSSGHRS